MPDAKTRGAAAAARLGTTTDEILAEVQRLPPELITWIPADGVWSVMDNLCHIREFVPFWTDGDAAHHRDRRPDRWGRDHTDAARLAAVSEHGRRTTRRRAATTSDGGRASRRRR